MPRHIIITPPRSYTPITELVREYMQLKRELSRICGSLDRMYGFAMATTDKQLLDMLDKRHEYYMERECIIDQRLSETKAQLSSVLDEENLDRVSHGGKPFPCMMLC